jgi:hypothetical protein
LPEIFVALLPAAGLLLLALRGGAYDVLARGEAFVLVWWLLGLGVAFGLLPRAQPPKGVLVAVGALLTLAAWMAVGLVWTESAEKTVMEVSRVLGLAGMLLLVSLTVRPTEWQLAVGAVTATGVVVCILALTSRLAPDVLTSDLVESGYQRTRLAHPLDYWNALGCWAAMTLALCLAWSAHAPRWWLRGVALASVCLSAGVVYLTYSRAAGIVVAVAVITIIVLSAHRWLAVLNVLLAVLGAGALIAVIRASPAIAQGSGAEGAADVVLVLVLVVAAAMASCWISWWVGVDQLRLPRRLTRVGLAVAACAAVLAGVVAGPALVERAWDSFQMGDKEIGNDPAQRLSTLSGERRNAWQAALDGVSENPLHGTGAGTYEFVWNRSPLWTHRIRDAHSLYLEALAELGLPGALLIVLALGALVLLAIRIALARRAGPASGAAAGCAAALLAFCVMAGVDWMWESTALPATALVCGGLAAAGAAKPVSRPRPLLRVAAVLMALVALAVQLPGLVAVSNLRASQTAIREGRAADAVLAATTAVDAEPWAARGHIQRALVLERLDRLRAAAADARRATARERTNWTHWLLLARIQAERRRVNAALKAIERARALNPRAPLFQSR